MEVLAFTVINKEIECDIKQVVGDNDYQASFILDDEWNDKEVICRVVWNNRTSLDIALEDLSCVIPAYIMKRGEVSIGVYAEGDEQLTTEPWLLSVRKSIREKEFETAMPHKEIWNEINEKIKNVITSNDLDEKVVLTVNDAIEKSGLVKNDELSTEVSTQVNAYLTEYKKPYIDYLVPNIYMETSGIEFGDFTTSTEHTCDTLARLGIKKVSLIIQTKGIVDGIVQLRRDYSEVVDIIHEHGMKVFDIRISNTFEGKANYKSVEALTALANSIVSIVDSCGLTGEIEYINVLNENDDVLYDSSLEEAIISCLMAIHKAGYKAGMSTGYLANFLSDNIVNNVDRYGINWYPVVANPRNCTPNEVKRNLEYHSVLDYLAYYKNKGVDVYISEIGYKTREWWHTNCAGYSIDDSAGEYVGQEHVEKIYSGIRSWAESNNILDYVMSINFWYTEQLKYTDELRNVLGGKIG